MEVKLVITDIDGVWTDGGMYYSEKGEEFKKFNTSDSVGVLLLKESDVRVIIMTGENSMAVKNRAKKLGIKDCYIGVSNKLELAQSIVKEMGCELENIAFIGDEVNDHELLKKVGFSCCPISAPDYTKKIVDFVVPTPGGLGAFRDFVIEIFRITELKNKRIENLL